MNNTSAADALYLAIDQGGHASRAMVLDHTGKIITEDTQEISASHPKPGHVEYDPDALITSITTAIKNAVNKAGNRADNIVAAGLATQRSNIACWDKVSGAALCPVLSWQDTRTSESLQQYKPYAEQIQRLTGLYLTAHYGASKFRWCLVNSHKVKEAHNEQRLICSPMTSFLLHHLLEEQPILSDYTNASRTLLLNINTLDWDPDLLNLFQIPAETLPHCVPNHYSFGTLKVDQHLIPLRIVTGDQPASLYASGSLQANTHYINVGTGAFIQHPTGSTPIASTSLLTSLIMHDGHRGSFAIEGTVNGAGSALQWFSDEYDIESLFTQLPKWLDNGQTPPLFLNGISGLGSPFWKADFESRFIGNSTVEDKAVAVLESIVFLLLVNIDEMTHESETADNIQISGGLSMLDGLCQRLADLSGLPVYRPVDSEATAQGLAWLLTSYSDNKPEEWTESIKGASFKPLENDGLCTRYQQWQQAMKEAL